MPFDGFSSRTQLTRNRMCGHHHRNQRNNPEHELERDVRPGVQIGQEKSQDRGNAWRRPIVKITVLTIISREKRGRCRP